MRSYLSTCALPEEKKRKQTISHLQLWLSSLQCLAQLLELNSVPTSWFYWNHEAGGGGRRKPCHIHAEGLGKGPESEESNTQFPQPLESPSAQARSRLGDSLCWALGSANRRATVASSGQPGELGWGGREKACRKPCLRNTLCCDVSLPLSLPETQLCAPGPPTPCQS